MATNIIGVKNGNVLVPYSAATKRTKEMVWTSSDIVVTGASFSNWAVSIARGYAYADSTGKWRLFFNVRGAGSSAGVRTQVTATFQNNAAVTFSSGATDYQPCSLSLESESQTRALGYVDPNASTIQFFHNSLSQTIYAFWGDVALKEKPSWADANMEGVTAVDVYIAPCAAGNAGIIDNTSGNTLGNPIKGKTDGVAVATGYVGEMAGTLRSGTGGFTYSVRSTTVTTTSELAVVAITLNKGVYIASLRGRCYRSDSATPTEFTGVVRVGGTAITDNNQINGTNNAYSASISFTVPIVITADSTVVDLYCKINEGTSSGNKHEINVIRIA